MIKTIKNWLEDKLFWLKTGATVHTANNGEPVDEIVIRHGDLHFGIMIDVKSGEPTGDFGWSRDPMMFHTPLRERYETKKVNL